jgi:anaerobic magnesium-protoporphyrin IX monomethyl ester cyclase
MKILLVVCPREFNCKSKFISVQLPINVLYLASNLIKYGFDVSVIDYNVEKFSKQDFIRRIKSEKLGLVGFSCMTPSIESGAYLAGLVKSNVSDVTTVVGGPHSNAIPKQTLEEFDNFDIVLAGDSENTIVELCNSIYRNQSISRVDNLFLRNGKNIVATTRKTMNNIDKLPFPIRNIVNINLYKTNHVSKGFSRKNKSIHEILTTRGCPNKCIFCLTNISYDKVLFRSERNVIAELDYCVVKFKAEHVYVMDDTFTANKNLVKKCCRFFRKHKITWHCNASINFMTKEIINLMSQSGCKGICYGVESGSQRVLDYIKKNVTVEKIKKVFQWSHDAKIDIIEGTFIVGSHPDENKNDINKTLQLITKIRPDVINVTKITPFPGTEIYNLMQERITGKRWSDFYLIDSKPQWRTNNFSEEQIIKLQKQILMKFYLSPRYLLSRIFKLNNFSEFVYWSELGIDYLRKLLTNRLT